MRISGVYSITSPSGKSYIGSSVRVKRRWQEHGESLGDQRHHCKPLQSAFNKYGHEKLAFEILIICAKKDLLFYEQRAIDILKPEYNVCRVAGSPIGTKRSEEVTRKMRELKQSPESRANMSYKMTGKKHTEEAKLKVSLANKGRYRSPEAAEKTAAFNRGKKRPFEVVARSAAARSRPVQCLETGQVFLSRKAAANWYIETGITDNKWAITGVVRSIKDKVSYFGYTWIDKA